MLEASLVAGVQLGLILKFKQLDSYSACLMWSLTVSVVSPKLGFLSNCGLWTMDAAQCRLEASLVAGVVGPNAPINVKPHLVHPGDMWGLGGD